MPITTNIVSLYLTHVSVFSNVYSQMMNYLYYNMLIKLQSKFYPQYDVKEDSNMVCCFRFVNKTIL